MRIRWVKVWVDAMATLTERFRDNEGRVDFEALGREEYAFRHALVTGDFSRSERARDLYDATINEITSRSEAGRKGAEARWNKNTADVDIREDSKAKPDGSAITRNETLAHDALDTSVNHYGDAATSDGAEVFASRESGDSVPTTVSNNSEDRQSQALNSQRAGGNSLRVAKVSTSPARSAGPAKHQHGEFGNVMLTTDEYIKLCEKCQDADSLITELDQYIESQGKARKYKSHYATLLNWSRRKAQEAKPKQGYMTSDDISKKNYQESKARLEAMFSKGRETA
jgi:hypothetical protein